MEKNTKLSVIYDITKECPWNCSICCMGATQKKSGIKMEELSLERKLSLMDDLSEVNQEREVHIDFSGGEILTNMDNIPVVEKAACLLGKDRVGISSSGIGMSDELAERFSHCAKDFEMTMDTVPGQEYNLRPIGYAWAAAKALPHLQKYGIETGIQTVLARSNCTEKNLRGLYEYLCEQGVTHWSLLKFYPSGRGARYPHEVLDNAMEEWVVDFIRELDAANSSEGKPEIDFHYTMKGHKKYSKECRCVRKSIGILPNGLVTACFWAVDSGTNVVDSRFQLGSVRENTLKRILDGEKAKYWTECSHKCELIAA